MPHYFTGPMASGVNLERIDATAQHRLGRMVEGVTDLGHWAKYRYVKFEDAVAYLAGHFVNLGAAETDWSVTNDISAAMLGTGIQYVGVGLVFQAVVPTENTYGWVQCAGIGGVLMGSASVIAGTPLKNDGTTDGALDLTTDGAAGVAVVARAVVVTADAAVGLAILSVPGV